MKKIASILLIMMLMMVGVAYASYTPVDGETHTAYSNNYKFYNKLDGGTVLNSGKPGMVFNSIKGLTTYTIDLYTPGSNSYVIVSAVGGKTITIEYYHSDNNTSPSAQDVYNKITRPWDKDAQERGEFNTVKEQLFSIDTSGGRKYRGGENFDFSAGSSTPAIIVVWKQGNLNFYIGDGENDGGPVATIPCGGVYNRVTTMGLNRAGSTELDWLAYISLYGDVTGL